MSTNVYDESIEDEKPYFLPIFSRLPAGLSPTRGIIRQGPAIAGAAFVGVVSFFILVLAVWCVPVLFNRDTMWDVAEMKSLVGAYFGAFAHVIPIVHNTVAAWIEPQPHLWSAWFESSTTDFIDMIAAYPFALGVRFAIPIVGSMYLAWVVRDRLLIPQYHAQHADGAHFIRGKAAVTDLRARMTKPYSHEAAVASAKPYLYKGRIPTAVRTYRSVRQMDTFLTIHPDIGASIKRVFNAGVILSGAPGSGKSVILTRWMWDAIERDYRSMIFDPKGEFVQLLGNHPRVKILSPFDKRSMVWDIARDCNTDPAMNAFAGALIPKSEKNPFFDIAAQMLIVGILKTLYKENDLAWGFADLAARITEPVEKITERLQEYAPEAKADYDFALDAAAQNIAGGDTSQTVNNILASLSVGARLIGQLARAWGKPKKSTVRFSAKAWAQDGYTGPRQVLLMTGEDKDLTGAYVASILNAAFRTILNDLTNDESRRLCFFMDEFPELPVRHIVVDRVMAVARGFGVCVFLAYQDHAQVIEAMGENKADTMLNLAALKVFCRVMPGSKFTQAIAEGLGKARITMTTTTQSVAAGQTPTISTSSHTEARNLVTPVQLTSETAMGLREPHQRERWQNWKPTGHAIRAILTMGTHVYRLDWPIMDTKTIKAKYGAQRSVPAKWTLAIGSDTSSGTSASAANRATEPDAAVNRGTVPDLDDLMANLEPDQTQPPARTHGGNNPTGAVTDDEDGRKQRLAELKAKKASESEATGERPSGNLIAVVDDTPTKHEAPREQHERPVKKTKEPGEAGADADEDDDPVDAVVGEIATDMALHAVGLGGLAVAVEIGKALMEAKGTSSDSKPVKLDKHGKPVQKTRVILN